jgi:hypothetical protein
MSRPTESDNLPDDNDDNELTAWVATQVVWERFLRLMQPRLEEYRESQLDWTE